MIALPPEAYDKCTECDHTRISHIIRPRGDELLPGCMVMLEPDSPENTLCTCTGFKK